MSVAGQRIWKNNESTHGTLELRVLCKIANQTMKDKSIKSNGYQDGFYHEGGNGMHMWIRCEAKEP